MSDDLKEQLLACPFCGSADIDSAFWMRDDEACGPGCSDCGATADTVEAWNMRASDARITELEAQLKNAMGDMALAEPLISAHVEQYHDFDYEPHAVPAEFSSLRFIQHHLLGSMLDEHGDLIAALDPKPTATGETP